MSIPLPRAEPDTDTREHWRAFLLRRRSLTDRMQLSTCDGCDGCGGRCADGFTVTFEEWEAARAYLAGLPLEEVERVRSQPEEVPWPGAEDLGAHYRRCRYRDQENARCQIYPVRPTVCRLFGHTPWLPCPIGAVAAVPDGGAALWNAYRAFPRRTWADWDRAAQTPVKGENDKSTGERDGVSTDDSLA